jgi:hypothetical protein
MSLWSRAALFLLAGLVLPACSSNSSVAPTGPEFELSGPTNGAIGVATTPTFTWMPLIGTATYTLQVSTDSGFSTFVVNVSGIAATSFTPPAALDPGTFYFWRVFAERPSGNVGADGIPWSFTTVAPVPGAFTMSAPANGATAVSTTPTFSWTASLGAASYRLQVSTDAAFGTLAVDQPGITATATTLTAPLQASTIYFWQVLAESTSATTASGAPWSFTTHIGPPGPFTLTSPMDGATSVSTLPTYMWNPATGADNYRLQVSEDFNFATLVIDQTGITGLSFTPSTALQSGTTYYWRVAAINAGGSTIASPAPLFFETG